MSRSISVVAISVLSVHDFRNFGEDVYRAIRDECQIDLDEIDRAEDRFSVRDLAPKSKGEVVQKIKKLARKCSLEIEIRNEK
jgi:hypothetical protein